MWNTLENTLELLKSAMNDDEEDVAGEGFGDVSGEWARARTVEQRSYWTIRIVSPETVGINFGECSSNLQHPRRDRRGEKTCRRTCVLQEVWWAPAGRIAKRSRVYTHE